MIVELQRHPDHLGAAARGERGDDRAVDAARHGDDDPRLGGGAAELEIGVHDRRQIGDQRAPAGSRSDGPAEKVDPVSSADDRRFNRLFTLFR